MACAALAVSHTQQRARNSACFVAPASRLGITLGDSLTRSLSLRLFPDPPPLTPTCEPKADPVSSACRPSYRNPAGAVYHLQCYWPSPASLNSGLNHCNSFLTSLPTSTFTLGRRAWSESPLLQIRQASSTYGGQSQALAVASTALRGPVRPQRPRP